MPPEDQKSEESSQPTAMHEPPEPTPIPPNTSEQIEVPPVAPESPREAESAVPVNNDNVKIGQ